MKNYCKVTAIALAAIWGPSFSKISGFVWWKSQCHECCWRDVMTSVIQWCFLRWKCPVNVFGGSLYHLIVWSGRESQVWHRNNLTPVWSYFYNWLSSITKEMFKYLIMRRKKNTDMQSSDLETKKLLSFLLFCHLFVASMSTQENISHVAFKLCILRMHNL